MSAQSIASIVILGLASYRITRLVVLDTLLDEPRMWVLRNLAPRPGGRLGQRASRLRRTRIKIAEGLQCSYCVGVWITVGLSGLWHLYGWARGPIVVAAVCGIQALLSSWEGE